MNITEILTLENVNEIVANLKIRPVIYPAPDVETLKAQYDVTSHKIFDKVYRPDKLVNKQSTNAKGIITTFQVSEPVARIGFSFQDIIVNRAVSFLFGSEVTLDCEPEGNKQELVLSMLTKVLTSNKSSNLNKELACRLFSETECAEYWYPVKDEDYWSKYSTVAKYKLRCKIFSPFLGDFLYPHFDQYGDMDAFSRGYYINEANGAEASKQVEYLDCYTRDFIYRFKNSGQWMRVPFITTDPETGEETEVDMAPNYAGRIPIVYYRQPKSEWEKVQSLIERYEDRVSNLADTNDYFGHPMLTVDGEVVGMPDKGERGKILQLGNGVKAAYLAWDQAPESVKLELDTLKNSIYSLTQTPDISFEQIKGLGNISGVALKLLFLDAHLKAQSKISIFSTALQRRYNIIKGFIGAMDADVKNESSNLEVAPIITPYLPSNETELIQMLVSATGGKAVMSQKTAVKLAGQVADTNAELEQIQKEEKESKVTDVFGTAQ